MRIVAVDSGTTSTRAWLVDEGEVRGQAAARAGARDLVRAKGAGWLAGQVRDVADRALAAGRSQWDEVEAVVAFGMITSELGLEELPHLKAPVDRHTLAGGMEERSYPEHLPVPILLVPGVLYTADGGVARADFMRGEETEVMGLLSTGRPACPFLFVSSGSHSKFVVVDDDARIAWSFTTLSGELVWALHRETILAGLIDPEGAATDREAVEEGSRVARETGLSRALFVTRLLNRLQGADPETCSAFVHGAVAEADLSALEQAADDQLPGRVAISGRRALAVAYRQLLEDRPWTTEVRQVEEPLGAMGAWELYAYAARG